jgi:hypothetical protein
VDAQQMAYRLIIDETKGRRVTVTLERRGAEQPLLDREVPREEAAALVAAALEREP